MALNPVSVGVLTNYFSSNRQGVAEERETLISSTARFVITRKQELLSMGVVACVVM